VTECRIAKWRHLPHLTAMTVNALQTLLAHTRASFGERPLAAAAFLALMATTPALAVGISHPSARLPGWAAPYAELHHAPTATPPAAKPVAVWAGQDIDGDGAPDIANPTLHAPRGTDAYGSGAFQASRDGGERQHQGVDYVAAAGQAVWAPISGLVTRIGYAYGDDPGLRYVEIENPALKISARVFYVAPEVQVGQVVRLGTPIGIAQTLQGRYPGGITDHVHLELGDATGHKLNAATLIRQRFG
jgi:murein DD-endopeptidase MepM/ murein hydrolase activator NlpD